MGKPKSALKHRCHIMCTNVLLPMIFLPAYSSMPNLWPPHSHHSEFGGMWPDVYVALGYKSS